MCVLAEELKIDLPKVKNDKSTTGSKRSNIPDDFTTKWAAYANRDEVRMCGWESEAWHKITRPSCPVLSNCLISNPIHPHTPGVV